MSQLDTKAAWSSKMRKDEPTEQVQREMDAGIRYFDSGALKLSITNKVTFWHPCADDQLWTTSSSHDLFGPP